MFKKVDHFAKLLDAGCATIDSLNAIARECSDCKTFEELYKELLAYKKQRAADLALLPKE